MDLKEQKSSGNEKSLEEQSKPETMVTNVTDADVAQLGVILQTCAKMGDWTLSGIQPKNNCKKCYGTGHVGRNITMGFYNICPCVLVNIKDAMRFYLNVKESVKIEKSKGEENNAGKEDGSEVISNGREK